MFKKAKLILISLIIVISCMLFPGSMYAADEWAMIPAIITWKQSVSDLDENFGGWRIYTTNWTSSHRVLMDYKKIAEIPYDGIPKEIFSIQKPVWGIVGKSVLKFFVMTSFTKGGVVSDVSLEVSVTVFIPDKSSKPSAPQIISIVGF